MDSLFELLYSVVQFQIYKMSFYYSLMENLHLEETLTVDSTGLVEHYWFLWGVMPTDAGPINFHDTFNSIH